MSIRGRVGLQPGRSRVQFRPTSAALSRTVLCRLDRNQPSMKLMMTMTAVTRKNGAHHAVSGTAADGGAASGWCKWSHGEAGARRRGAVRSRMGL